MKRKFLNGILLMAFIVTSVSSFVACKDYDEDIYTDMRGRLNDEATLREALEAQLKTLQQTVANLETELKNIKQCECDPSNIDLSNYATKTDLEALVGRIAALEAAKDQLNTRIDSIRNLLEELNTTVNDHTGRITKLESDVAKLLLMDQEIVAAKASAQEALNKAQEALEKANQALANAGGNVDLSGLNSEIEALKSLVKGLQDAVTSLEGRVQAVEGIAADALTKAEAAQAKAEANDASITALKAQIATINEWISNHKDAEGFDPSALQRAISNLEDRVAAIEEMYCTKCDVEEIRELAEKANKAIASLRDSIAKGDIVTLGQLRDSLDKYVTKVEFYDSIKVLRDSIDNFSKRIADLEEQVQALTNDIQNMITGIIVQATQSPVLGYFNAPVDLRSTLLAVYYGTPTEDWEFPSGKSTNYVNAEDIYLWTARNKTAIGGSFKNVPGYTFGDANVNLVSKKDGQVEGNAGTIYVTVNPANVNFTNKTLKLKDSQDNDAAVTLSGLQKSDRLLTFGYTRAADNGFYEAEATLLPENVDQAAMQIDYKSLEEDAKAIVKERSKSSVMEMGSALLKLVQDVTPAYALMGSWTDESSNTVHNVYSQYNVAATAVKPLSFNFMDGFNRSSMPGIGRLQNLVGEIIDKIDITVNLGLPDFAKYKGSIVFKDMTLPTIGDDMFRIKYNRVFTASELAGEGKLYGDTDNTDLYFLVTNVKDGRYALVSTAADGTTQKLFIYDPATDAYHAATAAEQAAWGAIKFDLTIDVDINKTPEIKSTLEDVVKAINDQFGVNSDLAKNITDLMNDVASLGNIDSKINGSIADAKADIKSQINSYITRANNKLTNWFNRLPGIMHLALIGGSDDMIGLLSQSKMMPTTAPSTTLKLVPTTYNLELLGPAYAKFVAVTDVFNYDRTEADINLAAAANGENMGKVIDAEKTCTMNGQTGYIYEITYTAIDYFGKVAIKKYYVRF